MGKKNRLLRSGMDELVWTVGRSVYLAGKKAIFNTYVTIKNA